MQSRTACACMCSRRDLLKAAAGAAALGLVPATVTGQSDPRTLRPQIGDRLVFSTGPQKGALVTPRDLRLGGPHVTAFAQDPATRVVRDGSRLNEVLLVRLETKDLTDAARANAPHGYIAFSAICTHAACSDWAWVGETKVLRCPCHESEFDPKDDARVLVGPATRRLPRLPLKAEDGALIVAGTFIGRVGGDLT